MAWERGHDRERMFPWQPGGPSDKSCILARRTEWIRGFAPRLYRRFALVQGARLTKTAVIAFVRLVPLWQRVEQRLTHFTKNVRQNRTLSKNSGQRNLVDQDDGPNIRIVTIKQPLTMF